MWWVWLSIIPLVMGAYELVEVKVASNFTFLYDEYTVTAALFEDCSCASDLNFILAACVAKGQTR